MFLKRTIRLASAILMLAALSVVSTAGSADIPGDSTEVSALLSQAKTEAIELKNDALDMETFTISPNLSWQSHAIKITEIKKHVNALGETLSNLGQAKQKASAWQKTAVDRIDPILKELAANTTAIIDHLNKEQGRLLNSEEHKNYLKENAELATTMVAMISDFVDYGQEKAKFESDSQKLE